MSVREELERLRKLCGGVLMPDQVVHAAKSKSSPLHNSFDWDDTEAAQKWRIEQARRLIRVFVTFIGNGEHATETRMYVSLGTDRENSGGYRAILDVLGDAGMRKQLLDDARTDMLRFRQKYAGLIELVGVFRSMSLSLRQITQAHRRLAVKAGQGKVRRAVAA